MYKIILLTSVLLLGGCGVQPPHKIEYIEKVVYDPDLPKPVDAYTPKWVVITKDNIDSLKNGPYVALTWNDNIRYRQWLEDVKRYIGQQNEIIQHYREANNKK